MRAGRLHKRVKIEQRSSTQDSAGEPLHTWSTFTNAYAAIEPSSARELMAAHAVMSEVTHLVMLRWQAGILPSMRVNYDGMLLNIQSIINKNQDSKELVLVCTTGLSEG